MCFFAIAVRKAQQGIVTSWKLSNIPHYTFYQVAVESIDRGELVYQIVVIFYFNCFGSTEYCFAF